MLMLGSPPDIDCAAVIEAMRSVEGVVDVHHVHLWQMQEQEATLDCHVVLNAGGGTRIEGIKSRIKARLRDEFGILHSSLEFEPADHAHADAALYGHGSLRTTGGPGAR